MGLLNFKKTKKASATTTGEFPFADAPNTATIVCCHRSSATRRASFYMQPIQHVSPIDLIGNRRYH